MQKADETTDVMSFPATVPSRRGEPVMKKFFLATRGRTGSTAVMDSLGKADAFLVAQELFYLSVQRFPSEAFPEVMPFRTYVKQTNVLSRAASLLRGRQSYVHSYLSQIENGALEKSRRAFGFKVLTHHLTRTPGLGPALKEHGYVAIYLTRDAGWQVLSGLIAGQRGVYNSTARDSAAFSCAVDISELERLITLERDLPVGETDRLLSDGFDILTVSYEDLLLDRSSFFDRIFEFLGFEPQPVPDTDFRVIIGNYESQITNFHEVRRVFDRLGVGKTHSGI
jgi:hypothetical protein